MKPHTRAWFALAVLAAAVGVVLILKPSPPSGESDKPQPPSSTRGNDRPTAIPVSPDVEIQRRIRVTLEEFRTAPDPAQAAARLRALRESILQAPEDATAAAIVEFIRSGDDVPTGLPFSVGQDGTMNAVPSLRLALLDVLPSLDPTAALDLAREIMDQRTTPDEYAISLRNLAWNDLDGDLRAELSGRFTDLLETPWLDQPSAGFLEAFDIAVEVGGKEMFDRMVSLARETLAESNSAASRATFMSLDRMIVREPAVLTAALSENPGWMEFAPQQRASLVSRLDIGDPEQRDLFVRYLTATSHEAGELEYFAKIFPNQNFLHGHRLVTGNDSTPTIAEVTAADARVLAELDSLDAQGEAGVALRTIRERLKKTTPSR